MRNGGGVFIVDNLDSGEAGTGSWGGDRPPGLTREPQSIAIVYVG